MPPALFLVASLVVGCDRVLHLSERVLHRVHHTFASGLRLNGLSRAGHPGGGRSCLASQASSLPPGYRLLRAHAWYGALAGHRPRRYSGLSTRRLRLQAVTTRGAEAGLAKGRLTSFSGHDLTRPPGLPRFARGTRLLGQELWVTWRLIRPVCHLFALSVLPASRFVRTHCAAPAPSRHWTIAHRADEATGALGCRVEWVRSPWCPRLRAFDETVDGARGGSSSGGWLVVPLACDEAMEDAAGVVAPLPVHRESHRPQGEP